MTLQQSPIPPQRFPWPRMGLGILWIGFLVYGFWFAPPSQPDTFNLIQNLSTGQWQGINPWIITLFNAMGIWPLIYSAVLLADGQGQRVIAWPFAILSFAVGAFAILPYLILRTPHADWHGRPNRVLQVWDSRWLGLLALLGAIACWIGGFSQGDWTGFVQQWQSDRFIHVMSLDFCLLTILFPILLRDDLSRRGMKGVWPWGIVALPLVGASFYLLLRKPLPFAP
jgi:hypothetical protein